MTSLPVVVVIDDDETFAEMLTWSLARRGFQPVACATPAAARAAFSEHDVAAVVCDIELGAGVVGTTLVAELRRRLARDVPAVFVSGYRSEFVQLDNDRDRFLQKPFSLGELVDVVAGQLANSSETRTRPAAPESTTSATSRPPDSAS